jgi:prepilin-type N-terminal cleavage/methylation domain-containing protein
MKKTRQGFTLIELLLVMAILGILTMLGLSTFMGALQKGRDSKRKSDLRQVTLALDSYFADKERYPDSSGGEIICQPPAGHCAWGNAFTDGVSMYMVQLPTDIVAGQRFYYVSDGTYYQIYTRLENTKDSDIPHIGTTARVFTTTNCSTTATPVHCNYGISSTNKTVTDGQTIGYE